MLTARSDTDETVREVSERVYRGTHALTQPHTLYLHSARSSLSGELISGATPHVVPAGDRTRVGRLATASATTELHARSPIFIFFKNVFYINIFLVSQFTVLYPYPGGRPLAGR